MLKKACGIFLFLLIFNSLNSCLFCAEEIKLGRISVSKEKTDFFNSCSLLQDQLNDSPYSDPIESLNLLPIDLQARSPKAAIQTDFSLRGANFQQALILYNGQRVNDPQTAHHNSDIPLTKEDILAINVIPGASSSLFGPDSIGGAINFITKKCEDKKIVLESIGGSHNSWSGLLSASQRINDLGFRFSVEKQDSGGFTYDTDFKKLTATFNSDWKFNTVEGLLNFGYQDKAFGAFDFYTPGRNYPSKEWTRTYLFNTQLNIKGNDINIKPSFLWRRHFDKFMLDKTQIRSTYLNHHRTDLFNPNLYLQKKMGDLHDIGGGLEYSYEGINSTNLGKHKRSRWGVFLEDTIKLSQRLKCIASLRGDSFDSFGNTVTGSINLKYLLSQSHSLNLGIARNIRIPSFTELYYNDPTTEGNAGLSAEESLNYELSYNYQKEKYNLALGLFFRDEKDVIDWLKENSSVQKFKAQNLTEDEVLGASFNYGLNLNQFVNLALNYVFVNKYVKDQGFIYKYGQNYTKHLLTSVLTLDFPFGRQVIDITYKKKPSQDPWTLINLHFSYDINKNLFFFVNLTNLFNLSYEEIEGIPSPGRWVEGGVRFQW